MKQHFIDTSGFAAEILVDDQYHEQALVIAEELQTQNSISITTDYVLSETLTLLKARSGHQAALQFAELINRDSDLTIVYTNHKGFENALRIFKTYQDKKFAFVDCLSFVVMRQRKITMAFTFDKHFEQAGFEIIKT